MKHYHWYLYGTPGNYRVTDLENARRYIMDENKTRKILADTLEDAIEVVRKWIMLEGDILTIASSAR